MDSDDELRGASDSDVVAVGDYYYISSDTESSAGEEESDCGGDDYEVADEIADMREKVNAIFPLPRTVFLLVSSTMRMRGISGRGGAGRRPGLGLPVAQSRGTGFLGVLAAERWGRVLLAAAAAASWAWSVCAKLGGRAFLLRKKSVE
jgi:hypothetical protein